MHAHPCSCMHADFIVLILYKARISIKICIITSTEGCLSGPINKEKLLEPLNRAALKIAKKINGWYKFSKLRVLVDGIKKKFK